MRTKTLLLTAALSAAGIATSMAQAVYSVNAVGYVNTTLKPGFNLISNPLTAADNSINALFGSIAGIPNQLTVYKFGPGGFVSASYDDLDGNFGANGALTVLPGEGVFVLNPTAGNLTVTFVGEVPQGDLKNPLPQGFSIKASQVPQEGTAAELGLVGEQADQIHKFLGAAGYRTSAYDDLDGAWSPALEPLAVGEAFFLFKVLPGKSWDRTFKVNP